MTLLLFFSAFCFGQSMDTVSERFHDPYFFTLNGAYTNTQNPSVGFTLGQAL